MTRRLRFLLAVLGLVWICSCKITHTIQQIHRTDADLVELRSQVKTVEFIPMHHVGTQEFYDHVAQIVKFFKAAGYKVYFEGVELESKMDSATADLYDRKFRKMIGVSLDTLGYAHYFHEHGLFRNLVDQPRYDEFGVDTTDVNVDVEKYQLVDAYEKKYGEIELSSTDKKLTMDEPYPGKERLPMKKVRYAIVDFRNEHLANYIQNSADEKIVVIYGEEHVEGTFQVLKRLNSTWVKK
jgi:hypothetical protein